MQPEFPYYIDSDRLTILRVEDQAWTCGMVRGSYTCGNDASYLYIQQQTTPTLVAVAACSTCRDEICSSGSQVTNYWREQQREWGVIRPFIELNNSVLTIFEQFFGGDNDRTE